MNADFINLAIGLGVIALFGYGFIYYKEKTRNKI